MEKNLNEQEIACCKTKYPIMLVHGTGVSDRHSLRCWGRIPTCLEAAGATVCFGKQDAWGSIETNKVQLAKSVDEVLTQYSAEKDSGIETNKVQLAKSVDEALEQFKVDKINIIAHSKGGLDARALAAMPEFSDKIASITTISTPHHGIGWLSKFWKWIRFFIYIAMILLYPFIRLFCGDKKPNPYLLAKNMTRKECERFNLETPNLPNVYYQSYAGKMPTDCHGKLFYFTRFFENRLEGDNDGMVSVDSAKWGVFRGIFTGGGKRGLSHADEIDFFKRNYKDDESLNDGQDKYSDVPRIYVRIASDLKNMGL